MALRKLPLSFSNDDSPDRTSPKNEATRTKNSALHLTGLESVRTPGRALETWGTASLRKGNSPPSESGIASTEAVARNSPTIDPDLPSVIASSRREEGASRTPPRPPEARAALGSGLYVAVRVRPTGAGRTSPPPPSPSSPVWSSSKGGAGGGGGEGPWGGGRFLRAIPASAAVECGAPSVLAEGGRRAGDSPASVLRFRFHAVFDEGSSQRAVMRAIGAPAVDRVLAGYHGTVMGYGQSGSGKTYGLIGPHGGKLRGRDIRRRLATPTTTSADPFPTTEEGREREKPGYEFAESVGMLPRMLLRLFEGLEATRGACADGEAAAPSWSVSLNAVELYNEELHDLLPYPALSSIPRRRPNPAASEPDALFGASTGPLHPTLAGGRSKRGSLDPARGGRANLAATFPNHEKNARVGVSSRASPSFCSTTRFHRGGGGEGKGGGSRSPSPRRAVPLSQRGYPRPTPSSVSRNSRSALRIRNTTRKSPGAASLSVAIDGMCTHRVWNFEQAMQVVFQALVERKMAYTRLNINSNRAHTLFFVHVIQKDPHPFGLVRHSILTLVDLAGSERVSQTGAEGMRLWEARKINLSLLLLGNVIRRLSRQQQPRQELSASHRSPAESVGYIPYRSSNLTRLLKDSFGGNAITFLLCNISPDLRDAQETLSTLRFASLAREVRNKPMLNTHTQDASEFAEEIERLRAQLKEAQACIESLKAQTSAASSSHTMFAVHASSSKGSTTMEESDFLAGEETTPNRFSNTSMDFRRSLGDGGGLDRSLFAAERVELAMQESFRGMGDPSESSGWQPVWRASKGEPAEAHAAWNGGDADDNRLFSVSDNPLPPTLLLQHVYGVLSFIRVVSYFIDRISRITSGPSKVKPGGNLDGAAIVEGHGAQQPPQPTKPPLRRFPLSHSISVHFQNYIMTYISRYFKTLNRFRKLEGEKGWRNGYPHVRADDVFASALKQCFDLKLLGYVDGDRKSGGGSPSNSAHQGDWEGMLLGCAGEQKSFLKRLFYGLRLALAMTTNSREIMSL